MSMSITKDKALHHKLNKNKVICRFTNKNPKLNNKLLLKIKIKAPINQTPKKAFNKMVIKFTLHNFQKWETLKPLGMNLPPIQNDE